MACPPASHKGRSRGDGIEMGNVAIGVKRLAGRCQLCQATGRCVVAAGDMALDDETVHLAT